MIGTRRPSLSSSSTMRGTAAAASSLFTVMRTSSDPARARAAHCWTVDGTSAVSVLVMDCTTIGASEPTRTPPTTAVTVFLRGIIAMGVSILTRGNRALITADRAAEVLPPSQTQTETLTALGPISPHNRLLVPCMHYAPSPKSLAPGGRIQHCLC